MICLKIKEILDKAYVDDIITNVTSVSYTHLCGVTRIGSAESSDRKDHISAYQRCSGNGRNIRI